MGITIELGHRINAQQPFQALSMGIIPKQIKCPCRSILTAYKGIDFFTALWYNHIIRSKVDIENEMQILQ